MLVALMILSTSACEEYLEVVPPGEFSPQNILTSEAGITSLLYSSYRQMNPGTAMKNLINMDEVSTDLAFNTGGGENRTLSLFVNWTWDASVNWINNDFWARPYRAIRDANLVLENIEQVEGISDETSQQIAAEARFIRAHCYADMYNRFGPVPLRTSSEQDAQLARSGEDELLSFIASELEAVVADLPAPGLEVEYGRATKGTALAALTKFYLNTKQWQKVVETAQQIENLSYYELVPAFSDIFAIDNEGNEEILLVYPCLADAGYGNNFPNGAFPPNFLRSNNFPNYEWQITMANWATQYRLQDDFVNTFDTLNDQRYELIIVKYENRNGASIDLRSTPNNTRSLKYFDPNALGNHHGNDFPVIRYADVLLSWAEALNELNGPTSESLGLINQVR
ncbi:MAG: RagB/SusD family nutrient uptake outer membrane protein, partial [Bacteroidota bacterium]